MEAKKRRKLDVSKSFDKSDVQENVIDGNCKYCGEELGTKTFNVNRHFERKHKEIHVKFIDEKSSKQPTIFASFTQKSASEVAMKRLVYYAGSTSFPLNHLRNPHFKSLLSLIPGFKIPHPQALKNSMEEEIKKFEKTIKHIIGDRHYAISCDIATAIANSHAAMGILVHFIDEKRKALRVAALDVVQFSEKHTADNIRNCIFNSVTNYGLSPSRVIRVVSDGAASMRAAFRERFEDEDSYTEDEQEEVSLEFTERLAEDIDIVTSEKDDEYLTNGFNSFNIWCGAHRLNLVIKDVMKDKTFEAVRMRVFKIVNKFARSPAALQKLKQTAGKTIIFPVVTRWLSVITSMERIVEIYGCINEVAESEGYGKLTEKDVKLMKEFNELLNPIKELLLQLQSKPNGMPRQSGLTISVLAVAIPALVEKYKRETVHKSLAKKVVFVIQKRFVDILMKNDPVYTVGIMGDIRGFQQIAARRDQTLSSLKLLAQQINLLDIDDIPQRPSSQMAQAKGFGLSFLHVEDSPDVANARGELSLETELDDFLIEVAKGSYSNWDNSIAYWIDNEKVWLLYENLMVYSFGSVLNNVNTYCQDKTSRLKQSFSPNRAQSPSNQTSDLEPSPTSTSSMNGIPPNPRSQQNPTINAPQFPPAPLIAPPPPPRPSPVPPLKIQTERPESIDTKKSYNFFDDLNNEPDMQRLTDQLNKLRPAEEPLRRTSAPGAMPSAGNVGGGSTNGAMPTGTGNRRYSEEYRDRNYHNAVTPAQFRKIGKEMIDFIANYMENVHNRRVVPSIEPGYLRELLPETPPSQPETYDKVMQDFEAYIMPGVTHWQHPRFHAYFPAANSYPALLATMLSDALGCVGFSWAACPAMTELETIMLQWFGEMIGLPKEFLPFTENGKGGGVIQGCASECNFVALLAARFELMKELRQRFPFVEEGLLMSKLIAYCSKEAHSSVEKAAMIGMVKLRILETDSKYRLRGDTLQAAITEDRNLGMIPFFVSTTLGTTSVCSFDVLTEIGPVCSENDLWLHVDAAYAGSAMICPEFRHLMNGIEYAMSFNTNPNKWMLVNFDCSTMWVKDRFKMTQAFVVDPLYLQHSWTDKAIDYRHWGVPLSRRFRSLKLWFVIRMYGVEGLQKYIRNHVRLAKKFEALLRADDMFEIIGDVHVALVCFRLKGSDELNQKLLTKLNSSGRIHMVPASLNDRFVIRFCVCHEHANEHDIVTAYEIIKHVAVGLQFDTTPEPIAENYELEKLEEEDFLNQQKGQSFDEEGSLGSNPVGPYSNESLPSTGPSTAGLDRQTPPNYPVGPNPQSCTIATAAANQGISNRGRFSQTLAEKRSFLVRMVSDPKCYNPKIVRHLNMRNHKQMSQDMFRDRAIRQSMEQSSSSTKSAKFPQKFSQYSIDNPSDEDEYVTTVASNPTGLQTPM
ncbi:unnamed protein product [Bursaphelenchus okinawaensis]|uniref:Uncharacterized protein n=1 Tax=Bursaphelenchus okinawaensis TaxID=465554 RepID=A0A811K1F6_9BILA|nr:unnamed protein product [Bursaphelenchus okinawaensis]CAG9089432.1 unnamed protein product [Bursaphelenchus okinawaensis]